MSVGQHVTWAESNGGGGGAVDRQSDNNSSRSRSTEQLDRLLRGLDELSGTLPDLGGLATASGGGGGATTGGRRSVSREREAVGGGQPPLPRADVLREGAPTPILSLIQ